MTNTDELDKMLNDLKSTVNSDHDRSSGYRGDNSLTSSFRSSSRNESQVSNRIEDAGLMRHHHKEYTSPDKSTRIVTDEYEYDSGDPSKSGQYQKKVKKSTYSTYKVSGNITDEIDALRDAPHPSITAAAAPNPEVVSASQKVANKLVNALSAIGKDPMSAPFADSSTMRTTSDYSTLTRLDKDIHNLDSILQTMEKEEKTKKLLNGHSVDHTTTHYHSEPRINQIVSKTERMTTTKNTTNDQDVHFVPPSSLLPNGSHSKYDEDMEVIDDGKGGEVRRIVWRNRFERTHESQDTRGPKVLTIEEDARRRQRRQEMHTTNKLASNAMTETIHPLPPQRTSLSRSVSPRQLQLQYAIYWPNATPNISPGSSWAEPVPLPTPPQLSPGEPGVAYVYTYGQDGGSKVQHLPPLNYVAGPPLADGAVSPTPSGSNQPIIYHYSYHYTLQPGQQPPDGTLPRKIASSNQPALQVAPEPRFHTPTNTLDQKSNFYEQKTTRSTTVNRSDSGSNRPGSGPRSFPREPETDSPPFPRKPTTQDPPNVSIMINKKTTHTTHTHDFRGPTTSTPSTERFPSNTTVNRTTYHNDSLERLKKPYQESRAFPDTSPIKPVEDGEIPRRVDDLMTTLDSQEGVDPGFRRPYHPNGVHRPAEAKPLLNREKSEEREVVLETATRREESKNKAGPPVYYPPGHHQLFDESMHTMSLKENKRRGQAKWRKEAKASGKESHSESKGGAAMVPVCLPLCCGAACVIM